jgi:hypothetical protein
MSCYVAVSAVLVAEFRQDAQGRTIEVQNGQPQTYDKSVKTLKLERKAASMTLTD